MAIGGADAHELVERQHDPRIRRALLPIFPIDDGRAARIWSVEVLPLVELIRTPHTDDVTLATAWELASRLRKTK